MEPAHLRATKELRRQSQAPSYTELGPARIEGSSEPSSRAIASTCAVATEDSIVHESCSNLHGPCSNAIGGIIVDVASGDQAPVRPLPPVHNNVEVELRLSFPAACNSHHLPFLV